MTATEKIKYPLCISFLHKILKDNEENKKYYRRSLREWCKSQDNNSCNHEDLIANSYL